MEVVVVDSKLWDELNQRLSGVEQLLNTLNKKNIVAPVHNIDWIPLPKVYELLGINRDKWRRHYSKLFKTRKFKRDTWVYKPDVDKWMMQFAIN